MANKKRKATTMYPLIEQYLASDSTQHSFCEQHQIPFHVFHYWLQHYRSSKNESKQDVDFIPMQVSKQAADVEQKLIIRFKNGQVLEIPWS